MNNLGTYGRWAFAEFIDVYEIEARVRKADRRPCRRPASRPDRGPDDARAPKPPAGPRTVETLVHANAPQHPDRRIPVARAADGGSRAGQAGPLQAGDAAAEGETRSATPTWTRRSSGAACDPLSQAQRKQLQETGEVELGDAQLVWRGKDTQDWSDLVVNPPPIYIQEKVHPKAMIEDLRKEPARRARGDEPMRPTCSPTSTA